MSTTTSELQSTSTPQILTRSVLSKLTDGLDAGDVLESYVLIRSAPLHSPQIKNATLHVHKMAIGLRYRAMPHSVSAAMGVLGEDEGPKKDREITLEFGPQRRGVSLSQESFPIVLQENTGGAGGGSDHC